MTNIEIISRGMMVIHKSGKSLHVEGELTFEPQIFYADLASITHWDPPFEKIEITALEKDDIISEILSATLNTKLKVVFD